jgi:hypothetical protein
MGALEWGRCKPPNALRTKGVEKEEEDLFAYKTWFLTLREDPRLSAFWKQGAEVNI